ncbi:hypothetical protein C8J57DRAFT_425470 [Mycena rebaudengoi]|nr:hypothetical protein C8J57DRAFT_425470 [Mycena rebaudengoi]
MSFSLQLRPCGSVYSRVAIIKVFVGGMNPRYNSGPYPSDQWNGALSHTLLQMNGYSSPYSAGQPPMSYDAQAANASYPQAGYYPVAPSYTASNGSSSVPTQPMYPSGSGSGSRHPVPKSVSATHAAAFGARCIALPFQFARIRAAISTHVAFASQVAFRLWTSAAAPSMAPHPYAQQVPLSPTAGTHYSEYSSSQPRPFSCDMCTLSFNRQHDLKRHRETHTGDKPYLCNGGCGKTFTRKDALKRHQLVKGCGKVDES